MPGFDRKGPEGEGPMTGRRLGRCSNFGAKQVKTTPSDTPENMPENFGSQVMGYGHRGRGRGRGMGLKNRFRGGE